MQYYIGQTVFLPPGKESRFYFQGEDVLMVQLFRFGHRDGRTYIVYTEEEEKAGPRAVYAGLLDEGGALWTVDEPMAETYIETLLEEMMRCMPQIKTLDSATAEERSAFMETFCAAVDRRMQEVYGA